MRESDSRVNSRILRAKKTAPQKAKPVCDIRAGDRVKIIGKTYATGQRIPSWVKLRTHTVARLDSKRALLKEINSWVLISDLRLAERPSVSVGSVVSIKPGAVYGGCTSARGRKVPEAQLSPKNTPSQNPAKPRHARSPARRYFELGRGRQPRGGVR